MLTTLYCDASFCPHKLVGGWAIWLRSEQGRIVENGVIPDYCKQPYEAELAAVYAGIYRASTRWPQTEAILVRSDCLAALDLMRDPSRAYSRAGRRLTSKIGDLRAFHGFRLIPRWVKGHQREVLSAGSTTDAWLNNRVDQLAREKMQEQRRAHEKSTKGIADKGPIAFPFSEEFHMAVRSTTSQFQPIPPNYTTAAGVYRNVGRYRAVNSATQGPVRGNMSTAPVNVGNTQYFYVPRLNG